MTNGQVHCIEAATGTIKWVEPMGKQYASPVLANGLVYMPNDEGVITIIEAGPEFKPVAKNAIGEKMFASPAISNGKIFLRGVKNLYCIGTEKAK
jgi:outer membrane protein assembly factor BamB